MTVRELIEMLENFDDDAEVRIAIQPRYPLQSTIDDVVSSGEAALAARDAYASEVRHLRAKHPGASEDEIHEMAIGQVEEDGYDADLLEPAALGDDNEEREIVWILEGHQLRGSGLDSPYAPGFVFKGDL